METVYVKEVNGEVWVDLGRHCATRLFALEEAVKAIAREVICEKLRTSSTLHKSNDGDFIPSGR